MGSNPGYLLKSFLLYLVHFGFKVVSVLSTLIRFMSSLISSSPSTFRTNSDMKLEIYIKANYLFAEGQ